MGVRSLPVGCFDNHRSTTRGHDTLNRGKPQPCPFLRRFGEKERVEDIGQGIGLDPFARVRHYINGGSPSMQTTASAMPKKCVLNQGVKNSHSANFAKCKA